MSTDLLTSRFARAIALLGDSTSQIGPASNSHHFGLEEISLRRSSPRRYSLLCHDTKTRIVVGGEGTHEGDLALSLVSDGAMGAFRAFLMHNHRRALYLHKESSADPSGYADYFEFSAWSQEPPVA